MIQLALIAIALLSIAAFVMAQARAQSVAAGDLAALHSRPFYHGFYGLLWVAIAGFGVVAAMSLIGGFYLNSSLMGQIFASDPGMTNIQAELILSDAIALAEGGIASKDDAIRQAVSERYASIEGSRQWLTAIVAITAAGAAFYLTLNQVSVAWWARNRAERIVEYALWGAAAIAILTTVGIFFSLIGETLNFFHKIDWQVHKYLFGLNWSPLSGVHEGKMDADKVGAIPLFAGTMMITIIAMLVATPIGLLAAIYLSDFASPRVRSIAKPMLEILAGIPTVVYGFFAALTLGPAIRGMGESIGLTVASESALAAGIVMGIMIIPFISSLSDDVINAVPQSLRDGSYGLGATKAETIRQVVLPAALPGVVSAVLLGVSRAIGETMIVVMAAGQGANLTANPLEAVTTVTVQIVMLITGDTEASTAAGPAFTLGFTLFCVTLGLNVVAQRIVARYREMYD